MSGSGGFHTNPGDDPRTKQIIREKSEKDIAQRSAFMDYLQKQAENPQFEQSKALAQQGREQAILGTAGARNPSQALNMGLGKVGSIANDAGLKDLQTADRNFQRSLADMQQYQQGLARAAKGSTAIRDKKSDNARSKNDNLIGTGLSTIASMSDKNEKKKAVEVDFGEIMKMQQEMDKRLKKLKD